MHTSRKIEKVKLNFPLAVDFKRRTLPKGSYLGATFCTYREIGMIFYKNDMYDLRLQLIYIKVRDSLRVFFTTMSQEAVPQRKPRKPRKSAPKVRGTHLLCRKRRLQYSYNTV